MKHALEAIKSLDTFDRIYITVCLFS